MWEVLYPRYSTLCKSESFKAFQRFAHRLLIELAPRLLTEKQFVRRAYSTDSPELVLDLARNEQRKYLEVKLLKNRNVFLSPNPALLAAAAAAAHKPPRSLTVTM